MWKTRKVRRRLRRPVVWVRHRIIRPGDAVLVSYPRSGSTWLSFILANLLLRRDPSFDEAHQTVAELPDFRSAPNLLPGGGRLLRSHEPWRAEYLRVVYLVRDPRDVLLSYYNYRVWLREFDGSLSDFVPIFIGGDVDSYGDWGRHATSWITAQSSEVLVIRFEDLKTDSLKAISQIATFLGIDPEPTALGQAIDNNDLSRMRSKEDSASVRHFKSAGQSASTGRFVQGGRSGDWTALLTQPELRTLESRFEEPMSLLGYPVSTPME